MHLSVTSKVLGTKLEVRSGKWGDDCSTASQFTKQRGRPRRGSGPNSEEMPDIRKQPDALHTTSGRQRQNSIRDKGKNLTFYIKYYLKTSVSWTSVTYLMLDLIFVIIRCSEVAHGVCWVCQTGMKSEMHGLWICHDCWRLLFLSPPQTRRLWVQVPLCGDRQTMG